MQRPIRHLFPLIAGFLIAPLAATAASAAQSPFNGTPFQVPVLIEAEQYDFGGSGVAYHDTTPGNVWNLYRNDDVDIGPFPNGGLHIGNLAAGEWVEYTINVPSTGDYDIRLRLASAYTGTTHFHIELDGVNVTGTQTVTSTGGWQNYVIKTLPNVQLTGGNNKILRMSFDTGFWNLDKFDINPSPCTPPTITSHPGNRTVEPGTDVSLGVSATGSAPLTYQWYQNNSAVAGNGSSLFIDNTDGVDTGFYKVRVSNACGSLYSNQAEVLLTCGPGELTETLTNAFQGKHRVCNWQNEYISGFPNAITGGSYNKPPLAAAIAAVLNPNLQGPDGPGSFVRDWWRKYLQGELGLRGSQWYFGGKEPFSGVYHHNQISAIMAINYEARRRDWTDVRDLAREWLRANFALMAAAATVKPASFHDRTNVDLWNDNYSGPWVATAGMRTWFSPWGWSSRLILYAHAVGVNTNDKLEFDYQKPFRTWLEGRDNGWDHAMEGDIYGLTPSEKSDLAGIRGSNKLPSGFSSWISGIHTIVPYHIVAWPGVRMTLMEGNRNNNTVPTYGMVYFSAKRDLNGQEAHFLYPWSRCCRHHRRCIRSGAASIDANLTWIEATNGPTPSGRQDCSPDPHPQQTVRIDNLPGGTPSYHIVL